MNALIRSAGPARTPEELASAWQAGCGTVIVREPGSSARPGFALVGADPFLVFRSFGSRCELITSSNTTRQFGDPWRVLEQLLARYEILDAPDQPFPLGACIGFWGYDLKQFVEPKLRCRRSPDLDLPDCWLGFYDSFAAIDPALDRTWVISTGLCPDGSRDAVRLEKRAAEWFERIQSANPADPAHSTSHPESPRRRQILSSFDRSGYIDAVSRAQRYIRAGDIYQVNLSQRFYTPDGRCGWDLYRRLRERSPAPCSAFIHGGEFQIASSSPELFLQTSGRSVVTRPIKGTRPRSADPVRDAQLSFELQTSAKETAELVMITDLLRNDLGRVCEFGSVTVPDLMRLERFPHVQHLVSTVAGRLRPGISHLDALRSCFPGGSITGAPKVRAMEIIDELEPVSRGPYTGAIGYIGFNQESSLSIAIRAAVCIGTDNYFATGAGIVADSIPELEYEECLAKAAGFAAALNDGPETVSAPFADSAPTRRATPA